MCHQLPVLNNQQFDKDFYSVSPIIFTHLAKIIHRFCLRRILLWIGLIALFLSFTLILFLGISWNFYNVPNTKFTREGKFMNMTMYDKVH